VFGNSLANTQVFTGSVSMNPNGLFVSSSGNVGIGTITPDRALCIQGTGEAWTRYTTTSTSTKNWLVGQDGSRKGFEVYDASLSATRLFIEPINGYMGLSNIAPSASLSFSNGTGKKIDFYNDGTARYGAEVNASELRFYTTTAGDIISFYANNTLGLVIKNGNVGIGVSSPSSNYGFSRTLSIENSANAEIQLVQTGGPNYLSMGLTSTFAYFQSTVSYNWQVGGSAKMTLTSGGNLGIATTSPAVSLQINSNFTNLGGRLLTSNTSGWASDGQTPTMVISNTTTSTSVASQIGLALHNDSQTNSIYTPVIVFSRKSNSGSYNSAFVSLMGQVTGQGNDTNWVAGDFIVATANQGSGGDLKERFRVLSTGAATLTGALTQNSSDKRLKDNIKNIENALDKLVSLNGVTFDWNEIAITNNFIPRIQYNDAGVIAQEVQQVLPQAVDFAPFDRHNGESKSGENYLTVQYEKLIPLLIEAIKEQQAQIEAQQQQINTLLNK
jgi:hypothetical protein